MSNVDRLAKAGVLNPDVLSPEHKDFINHELTAEEVNDLIKVGEKFAKYCKDHQHHGSAVTVWV
jgi:hypothetical protein